MRKNNRPQWNFEGKSSSQRRDFVSTKMTSKRRYHTSRGQNSYSPSFSFSDLQLTNDKSEKSGRPVVELSIFHRSWKFNFSLLNLEFIIFVKTSVGRMLFFKILILVRRELVKSTKFKGLLASMSITVKLISGRVSEEVIVIPHVRLLFGALGVFRAYPSQDICKGNYTSLSSSRWHFSSHVLNSWGSRLSVEASSRALDKSFLSSNRIFNLLLEIGVCRLKNKMPLSLR